jgi:hypothetical protein
MNSKQTSPSILSQDPQGFMADIDSFLDKMENKEHLLQYKIDQFIERLDNNLKLLIFKFQSFNIKYKNKYSIQTKCVGDILILSLDRLIEVIDKKSNYNFDTFKDAIEFSSHTTINTPAILLNDFGNIRLFWCNEKNEQVGLQFLGNSQIQYVIFSMRNNSELNTCHGRTHIDNVRDLIIANGLKELVYHAQKRRKLTTK